ncbi:MAG: hypothetical protein ACI391_04625, partial [Muribaculaceae bacterium]
MKKSLLFALLVALSSADVFAAVEISSQTAQKSLAALDDSIAHRIDFVNRRQRIIDNYINTLNQEGPSERLLLAISEQYTGFNNDSALHYLEMGLKSD